LKLILKTGAKDNIKDIITNAIATIERSGDELEFVHKGIGQVVRPGDRPEDVGAAWSGAYLAHLATLRERRRINQEKKEREKRNAKLNRIAGYVLITILQFVAFSLVAYFSHIPPSVAPEIIQETAPVVTLAPAPILPTATPEIISTPAPTPTYISEAAEGDGNVYNGYWWYGMWVPGLPTIGTQFLRMPDVSTGSSVFYAPDVMEATAKYRGLSMDGYVGAVAVPFASEIGHRVWLKRPGLDWEGPFLVADCSRRNDMYGHIEFNDQVVEVDFDTAVKWGMARYGGDQNDGRWSTLLPRLDGIILSKVPPENQDGVIIDLSEWFLQHVEYAEITEDHRLVAYPPAEGETLPTWLIGDEWIMFR
jgi:hypothetical protein